MTDLSISPHDQSTHSAPAVCAKCDDLPLVVGLSEMLVTHWSIVGARAERLSLAIRSHLPVPAGAILTAAALGCTDHLPHRDSASPADAVSDVFDQLGRGGRMPLMVGVSTVSQPGSAADRIVTSRSVTSRSELLHTVRRLSATASMLGEEIAIVIQRDLDFTTSGTLTTSPSGAVLRDSIVGEVTSVDQDRLVRLGLDVAAVFDNPRMVTWALDRSDQLWILDIGPSAATS